MATVHRWDGGSCGSGRPGSVRAWWRVAVAAESCGAMPARARHDGHPRARAPAVRSPDRLVPGRAAPVRGVEVLVQGASWLALEAAWSSADAPAGRQLPRRRRCAPASGRSGRPISSGARWASPSSTTSTCGRCACRRCAAELLSVATSRRRALSGVRWNELGPMSDEHLDLARYDAEQNALAVSVRGVVARSLEAVIAGRRRRAARCSPALWNGLAELGVLGLATPEGGGAAQESPRRWRCSARPPRLAPRRDVPRCPTRRPGDRAQPDRQSGAVIAAAWERRRCCRGAGGRRVRRAGRRAPPPTVRRWSATSRRSRRSPASRGDGRRRAGGRRSAPAVAARWRSSDVAVGGLRRRRRRPARDEAAAYAAGPRPVRPADRRTSRRSPIRSPTSRAARGGAHADAHRRLRPRHRESARRIALGGGTARLSAIGRGDRRRRTTAHQTYGALGFTVEGPIGNRSAMIRQMSLARCRCTPPDRPRTRATIAAAAPASDQSPRARGNP